MILLGGNKITSDMITVTGGSVSLGATRLINQTADEVCMMNDNIVIDFGTATNINAIAVVNSSADVTIQANATDVWTAPSYSATLDEITGSRVRVEITTATQSYRYWRLKSTGLAYIGYLYLGEKITIAGRVPGDTAGIERFDAETEIVGGVSTYKQGYSLKSLKAQINSASDTELKAVRDYWLTYGKSEAIIVPFEDEEQTAIDEVYTPFFCRPIFEFTTRSRYNVNRYTLTVQEIK